MILNFISRNVLRLLPVVVLLLMLAQTEVVSQRRVFLRHISIDDGLSQGTVQKMLQDKKGFFWFATKDGLNKFDGYTFKVYKNEPGNPKSLSQNWIQTIELDRNEDIWVATKTGFEFFSQLTEQFSRISIDIKGVPDDRIYPLYSIREDTVVSKGDHLYIGTTYGLLRYNKLTKKTDVIYKLEQPPNLVINISAVFIDNRGNVWFGTNKNLIGSYDPVANKVTKYDLKKSAPYIPGSDYVAGIEQDAKGRIIAVTNCYIWVKEPGSMTFSMLKSPLEPGRDIGYISSMVVNPAGGIYVGISEKGLFSYTFESGIWQEIIPQENDKIRAYLRHPGTLTVSRSGNLWIGLNGYGAMVLAKGQNRFERISGMNGSTNIRSLRGFLPFNDTTVYLGGYSLFATFNPKTRVAKTIREKFILDGIYFNDNIYQISLNKSDGGKSLWMTSEGDRLYKYIIAEDRIERVPFDDKAPGVNSTGYFFQFVQDENNTLWITTETGVVNYNPANGKWHGFPGNSSLEKILRTERIVYIAIDKKGRLLIGSDRNGLFIYDRKAGIITRSFFDKRREGTDFAPSIRSIFIDSKGNTWLGTSNGLVKFNEKGRSISYTVANGLPNDMVYGILEDRSGKLWLSTNKGISRFDPVKEEFVNFTVDDGLQSNEFNTAAFASSPDGTFYFGGIEGFNMFDPLSVKILDRVPGIALTGLKLFSRDIPLQPGVEGALLDTSLVFKKFLRLDHDKNDLTFELSGLDFNSNSRILYSFKLEGYSKEWSVPSFNRIVNFTNLSPGTYTLMVKVANKDGIWSGETALISIEITPPFWETWWFMLLLIAAILIAIFGTYLYRVRAIQLQNEKLEALIKVRTHELEEYKDQLIERQKDLETSNSALEEANRQKDRFFSMFAHDVKSPFSAILGYLDILHNDYKELSEHERLEFIGSVTQVSKNLFLFVENVLDLFRIELGRVIFAPEYFPPQPKIDPIIDVLSLNLIEKQLEVTKDIPNDLIVYSDPHMFRTIVQNLLANAIKYSNPGGQILIAAEVKGDYAEFSVSDSGVGMTHAECARLFHKNDVYSKEGTKKEQGTGLGLMICKDFVERNGGKISVASEEGVGTTFMFTIPVRKPVEEV